jgi:ATP-dependent Clp protease adaptor protein ClpS
MQLNTDILEPEVELKEKKQTKLIAVHDLVLFNDDVNTFDHVIDCLIKICDHEALQAEQCAHIVHFKGKCEVKSGSFEKLKPMCEALLDQGLSAKIN